MKMLPQTADFLFHSTIVLFHPVIPFSAVAQVKII